jgi:GrpB-like predicted nucleotidyltransferase (UPF0157 family)
MPTREAIVGFADDSPPDGRSPWVDGARPQALVEVVDPDARWPECFGDLDARIRATLGPRALQVEHVGSTAVPGLPAKPVIDVDLTVADPAEEAAYVPPLERAGFTLRIREPWWYEHRLLVATEPTCNLHVFGFDSPELVRHRIFRDWLRTHDSDRQLYATVKRRAAAEAMAHGENAEQYNARKERVVREIYRRAFLASGLLSGQLTV